MFEIIQESANLPLLTETSLYSRYNKTEGLTEKILSEIRRVNETRVKVEDMTDIMALMRLNGDQQVKYAVKHMEKGDIIILNDTPNIPSLLPFITINKQGDAKTYVFADKVVDNINSSRSYVSLMTVIEAAHLARSMSLNPSKFLMNRQLVLSLCDTYTRMVVLPLRQKLYMSGENLIKAMLYTIAYFYRMVDGPNNISAGSIPYKRIIADKVDDSMFKEIVEAVKALPNNDFMNFLELIKNINPIRYEKEHDIKSNYVSLFISVCGVRMVFALENICYLFLAVVSASYKSSVSNFVLDKAIGINSKKIITTLNTMDFD